jgi:hypothetical protein
LHNRWLTTATTEQLAESEEENQEHAREEKRLHALLYEANAALSESRSSSAAAVRAERERCTALESELSARSDAVAEAQVTCHAAQAEADKAAYQLAEAQLSLESLTVSTPLVHCLLFQLLCDAVEACVC